VARTPCNGSSGSGQQSQTPQANNDCSTAIADDEGIPYFGDNIGLVKVNHFRLRSINLNNLLQNPDGDEQLFRETPRLDKKILCMQEVGCNWSMISPHQSFQQRLKLAYSPHDTRACKV
jgi:hypothetical protein